MKKQPIRLIGTENYFNFSDKSDPEILRPWQLVYERYVKVFAVVGY